MCVPNLDGVYSHCESVPYQWSPFSFCSSTGQECHGGQTRNYYEHLEKKTRQRIIPPGRQQVTAMTPKFKERLGPLSIVE